jgi:putative nucleotidyltransferase with HDIG domain/diguanylate cyclase (GGDEF)-like protein
MTFRVKALVCLVVAGASASLYSTSGHADGQWLHFFVYLAAILLSSGMKVALPKTESTMSVNFPFILLGILQLSPLQAVILAVSSVVAQCRFRVIKPFTLVQILFNVANVATATVLAWHTYAGCLRLMGGEVSPALAVAASVYFLANSVPVTLILAWDSGVWPADKWRQEYLWYLPFYLVGAMLAAAANVIGVMFGWMTSLLIIPMVYTVYRAYCSQQAIVRDRERHIVETEALHLRTIEGLAMAVEAKDQNTHRHLMRVRVYVTELGKAMGLDKPLMQALTTASFLHDIGKLAVPERIINKPGKLTPEEFEKMKIHPVVGADILERVHFPYPVVPIVRSHHESWDGAGYPDGLKGEEIPIGARILTAVDCFDALASERPYRRAMPLHEAMAFVKSKAGIQFDPQVVELLAERYQELEELARQQIEEVEPLKTDLFIERGAAPGAGFVPEQSGGQKQERDSGKQAQPADVLSVIADATREVRAVFELGRLLDSSLSPRALSEMISVRLRMLIAFDCFAVYLKREDSVAALYLGGPLAGVFSARPIPLGEGLSGWVAESEQPILNGNPTVEANFERGHDSINEDSSALSIPLFDLKGVVFGALTLYSSRQAAFSQDHLRILRAIESNFSLSLQNAIRFEVEEKEANDIDDAQFANMRQFLEKVDAEVRSAHHEGRSFGIGVCNLNSLKGRNNLNGDAFLRTVAQELCDCTAESKIIVRTCGDEFAFLFSATAHASADSRTAALESAARRICGKMQIEEEISPGVGVAFYPQDGECAERLLGAANRRMRLRMQEFARENKRAAVRHALEGTLAL